MVFELLHERIKQLLKERGFEKPTLPQLKAIPEILKGKNVLIISPTGHGKTEAALLPLFSKIIEQKPRPISLIYITPLKSLNRDMLERILWWANKLGISVSVRHGDTTAHERKLQAEHPDDIIIITPEQLQAMLTGKKIRKHLENVKWVVVDELHELVESKRGVQLAVALERLKKYAKNFQIISLSATVSNPEIAAKFIGCDTVIKAFDEKEYEIKVITAECEESDIHLAEKIFLDPNTIARLRMIKNISEKHTSVLIFTNTRETAEILSSRLRALYPEFTHEVHHSSLSKHVRIKAEREFKENKLKALIATSSLELGIDIGTIDCVIQYMSPRQVVKFLQRVGRSGHRKGKKSKGFIIAEEGDDLFESAVIAKFSLKNILEDLEIKENSYDVLAHQIMGMLIEGYESAKEIFEVVKKSFPYRNLSYQEFKSILELMKEIKLIKINAKIKKKRKGLLYYFENLTTIPETSQYKVIDVTTKTLIGKLDESWVAEHGEIGNTFIVKGSPWRIVGIEENIIFAEPVEDIASVIPAWEGELIPVPFHIAQEVGRLRRIISEMEENQAKKFLIENYCVSEKAAEKMISFIKSHAKSHAVPDDKTIIFEKYSDFVIIHCCFGSKVNQTLGKFISAILSAKYGESIAIKTDAYRIIIYGADLEEVKKTIFCYNPNDIEPILRLSLPRSNLFKYKFIQVAKRFGVIRKNAKYDKISINKIIEVFKNTPLEEEVFREIFQDKLDIEKTKQILSLIQKNKFKILEIEGLSVLGKEGLKKSIADAVKPEKMEKEIFNAFVKRLMETRLKVVCINCGKFSQTMQVKNFPEKIFCKVCGSALLGVAKPEDKEIEKIIKKRLRGEKLSKSESIKFEKIVKTADVVIAYGKKALIALAGRGIGPTTAMRILSKMHRDEESFLKDIYKAEKQYLKTKRFWKE